MLKKKAFGKSEHVPLNDLLQIIFSTDASSDQDEKIIKTYDFFYRVFKTPDTNPTSFFLP